MGLIFALMAPSGMVLASWNAVPGDTTYTWKTSLEGVLLAVLPSNKLKSATNSKLTERRMGEVSKVLSGTHAKEGLDNLSDQVLTTKESLNKIDNAQDRAVAVAQYIQTLNEVNSQLETEKQSRAVSYAPPQAENNDQFNIKKIRTTPPANKIETSQPTQPSQPGIIQPTQQPPSNQPNPPLEPTAEEPINDDISSDIDQTKEEIDNIIDELEDIIEEAEEQSTNSIEVRVPQVEKSKNPQIEQPEQQQKKLEVEKQPEMEKKEVKQKQETRIEEKETPNPEEKINLDNVRGEEESENK